MRVFKLGFGLVAAMLPVAYCGGLLYYFSGVGGSVENATALGLGPTMLGLGAIGVLLCIPVILKLFKIVGESSGSAKVVRDKTGAAEAAEEPAFDADAALARYMARKAAAEGAAGAPSDGAGFDGGERRATFGRKAV